jgi:hypothetical protein
MVIEIDFKLRLTSLLAYVLLEIIMHFPIARKKTFYIRRRSRGRKKPSCHFGEVREVNSFMPLLVENILILPGGIKHGNLRKSKITINIRAMGGNNNTFSGSA